MKEGKKEESKEIRRDVKSREKEKNEGRKEGKSKEIRRDVKSRENMKIADAIVIEE